MGDSIAALCTAVMEALDDVMAPPDERWHDDGISFGLDCFVAPSDAITGTGHTAHKPRGGRRRGEVAQRSCNHEFGVADVVATRSSAVNVGTESDSSVPCC
jgi:hypothetical protein